MRNPEGGGERAVDAVGPAVEIHLVGQVVGRPEKLDVAHRHGIRHKHRRLCGQVPGQPADRRAFENPVRPGQSASETAPRRRIRLTP
jgi:hypothetical protein